MDVIICLAVGTEEQAFVRLMTVVSVSNAQRGIVRQSWAEAVV